MSVEIEHKYLTSNDSYKEMAVSSQRISQGYLSRDKERTVRIRTKDDKGYITVKTKNIGDARNEFEYEIPFADAAALLKVCLPPVIQKTRYLVPFGDFLWEIDEFKAHSKALRWQKSNCRTATPATLCPLLSEKM